MRTGLTLSLAAGAVALALLLPAAQASAAPVSGASNLPAATQGMGSVEQARTVCRRYWNGYRWRQRCWWVPNYGYYGPGPYYRHHHRYYRW
jgi:hypothetical protein